MARWVVDLPGTPGPDAIDGTAFSSWIQPPDDTARMTTDAGYTDRPAITQASDSVEETRADPPVPADDYPADVSSLANALMPGFTGVPAAGNGAAFEHDPWRQVSGQLGDDDDPFYFVHSYGGRRGGTAVTPHANVGDLFWNGSLWLPDPPEGAIGYEVETVDVPFATPNPDYNPGDPTSPEFFYSTASWPLADPTSLDLTVSLQTATGTGTNGGSIGGLLVRVAVNDLIGSGEPRYRSEAGATWFELVGEAPTVLQAKENFGGAEHAVIGSGIEALPTEYQFTVSSFGTVPPRTGLFGLYVGMTSSSRSAGDTTVNVLVGANGEVQSSDGLTYTGTYTIRPPRFRWIYGTVAIQQTTHRDDHLAGGAYQTWPAPTSRQQSNTTFGGYL